MSGDIFPSTTANSVRLFPLPDLVMFPHVERRARLLLEKVTALDQTTQPPQAFATEFPPRFSEN